MIEPHYFGTADHRLLGIYHPPSGKIRAQGVVICPPAPQEYMRTHMALRKLGTMLATSGIHVLRFDYSGTGDSAGSGKDGSLSEWQDDIVAATTDLKEASSVTKVSLFGFRLGATLAALTPIDVARLVLLEPVVNGRRYLEELRGIHVRKFSNLLYPPPLPEPGQGGELLGVPFPARIEREIATIDLSTALKCRAEQVSVLTSTEIPELARLQAQAEAVAKRPVTFRHHRLPGETRPDHDRALLLPPQVLQYVMDALSGRAD
jgi:pimeloyl-ACP methyl ester carboxylesterase